jgi:hypothetical protein
LNDLIFGAPAIISMLKQLAKFGFGIEFGRFAYNKSSYVHWSLESTSNDNYAQLTDMG